MQKFVCLVALLFAGCALGSSSVEMARGRNGRPQMTYKRSAGGIGSLDDGASVSEIAQAESAARADDRMDRIVDHQMKVTDRIIENCQRLKDERLKQNCLFYGGFAIGSFPYTGSYSYNELGMLEAHRWQNLVGQSEPIFIPPQPRVIVDDRGSRETTEDGRGDGKQDRGGGRVLPPPPAPPTPPAPITGACNPDAKERHFANLIDGIRKLLAAKPLKVADIKKKFSDGEKVLKEAMEACRDNKDALVKFRGLRVDLKKLRNEFDEV